MQASTRWTLIIVGILGGSVLSMGTLIYFANDSRAGNVIPDYYQKAAHYDDTIAVAEASRQTGWTFAATWTGELVVHAVDRDGRALSGASVRVEGFHRAFAGERISQPLREHAPGVYVGEPAKRVGAHDLQVTIDRDGQRFRGQASLEAQP